MTFAWDEETLIGESQESGSSQEGSAPAAVREWIHYPETFEPLAVIASTGERLAAHTVRGWFTEWLESKAGAMEAHLIKRYRRVLDGFLESLGSRANMPLTGVSARDVVAYRNTLRAGGRMASTTNALPRSLQKSAAS